MYKLKIFKNDDTPNGPKKILVAVCKNKKKAKLEELCKRIGDNYYYTLIDLEFERLKEETIKLCNKNAGLEIEFSELPSIKWLGEVFEKKCIHPIFCMETKEVTLKNGKKQVIPTKCILLHGIDKEDLEWLFNTKEELNKFYKFLKEKVTVLSKLKA